MIYLVKSRNFFIDFFILFFITCSCIADRVGGECSCCCTAWYKEKTTLSKYLESTAWYKEKTTLSKYLEKTTLSKYLEKTTLSKYLESEFFFMNKSDIWIDSNLFFIYIFLNKNLSKCSRKHIDSAYFDLIHFLESYLKTFFCFFVNFFYNL